MTAQSRNKKNSLSARADREGLVLEEEHMGHRKMPAYGEREHGGRYVLDDYVFSRNHNKAERIRRWKRDLKKRARAHNREVVHQAMQGEAD